MAQVVINEFELSPASSGDQAAGGAGASGAGDGAAASAAPSQPKVPVQETERIMRRQAERLLRILAH
jgi:hypothetical protein